MKRRTGWLLLYLLILPLMFCSSIAVAEEVQPNIDQWMSEIDVSGVQQIADEAEEPLDVAGMIRQLASGAIELDVQKIGDWIKDALLEEFSRLPGLMISLAAPMVVWAVLKAITPGGYEGISRGVAFVCYLAAASALIALFSEQVSDTRAAISTIANLTDQLIPILTALLAATGAPSSAAMFTPAAAMAGGLISSVIRGMVIPFSLCAAALVVAGNLGERIKLKRLNDLIVSTCNWSMGILMTAFLGIMTVQGILTAGYDGVSIRTARFTVDNLLPIVGGEVADTMDMMVASAGLVKNGAGVTGLVLLISFCAGPLIRLLTAIFAVKLSAAIVQPISDGPIDALVQQFSGVFSMLLVALVTCMVIFVVMIGAVIMSGRGLMG